MDHLGLRQPRVCCPPGCALANPGAPPLCLWHVHPLAPSGQGVPEGARAVDRRPFPRPVRGARGPQGGRGPGPARARCSIAIGACITPGLHSNTAGSAPDYPREAAHLRRIWDRRIPGAGRANASPCSRPGLDIRLSQEGGGQQAPRPQEASQARGVVLLCALAPMASRQAKQLQQQHQAAQQV